MVIRTIAIYFSSHSVDRVDSFPVIFSPIILLYILLSRVQTSIQIHEFDASFQNTKRLHNSDYFDPDKRICNHDAFSGINTRTVSHSGIGKLVSMTTTAA